MGVIHKLKPEIINFIIENKRENPALSCRDLSTLLLENLHVKVSKSSINNVFKDNKLSMPIGRRRKPKQKKFNMPALPVIDDISGSKPLSDTKQEEEARRLKEAQEAEEMAKAKAAEEARLLEEKRLAQEAEESKKQEEALRLEEERKKQEEEACQTELNAEKERWIRISEEEQQKLKQDKKVETVHPEGVSLNSEASLKSKKSSGLIMLKAIDCLIGGSKEINSVISWGLGSKPESTEKLTEALIFSSLFRDQDYPALGALVGAGYSREELNNYFDQIKQIADIVPESVGIVSELFTEAKGVKISFADGSISHLDGQLHSIWPATRFPCDFSNTIHEIKKRLDKHFMQGEPLVLLSPSSSDIFPPEFFDLIVKLSGTDNHPEGLVLFGDQLEELEKISLVKETQFGVVFGIWPWQFSSTRKVKKIGDFSLRHIEETGQDLYLGDIEIDLFCMPNRKLSLKGCAVKTDLREKIRLVILSSENSLAEDLNKLAGIYLSHWPDFEEAFQDFNSKIELFKYTGAERKIFPKENFDLNKTGAPADLTKVFSLYLKMLDEYLRWHFLPSEYSAKDFSYMEKFFYSNLAELGAVKERFIAKLLVSNDYQFLKDLGYFNNRLNERKVKTSENKIFWFENAFK